MYANKIKLLSISDNFRHELENMAKPCRNVFKKGYVFEFL